MPRKINGRNIGCIPQDVIATKRGADVPSTALLDQLERCIDQLGCGVKISEARAMSFDDLTDDDLTMVYRQALYLLDQLRELSNENGDREQRDTV